ncbi:MAG: heme ABC exporter ATP-binding protein CcmA [Candidatus Latescibacteria bacterium]|nr:heme ABC exporter ATP-binding protein CcmA [Candidatus Latescibacterota bacterium]NIM22397.1 heme ABC exporter ATP-binding protein CcmA [Candidatus Latescibacterota bacterium]NIM64757.1 heme ABC exporter ATP-binding protein CcmA [Candidatus Latescibacterota bacterium]NIO01268.1 heme ABC exporter ATP-binding protein CcmA [Candidatus Latescibacterota bacterium]NIO27760.1 heme ABC exporter ATP-binding protein CcmA [Candidatus Latescibacterota bacterium]
MTPNGLVLETTELAKQFGRLHALRSISLTVELGEFLTIFGRNGAGKTTFLRIVSSLIRSYSGKVTLFGKDLRKAEEDTRRRIGFISHESFLYKDLTVADNLTFYGRLYGVNPLQESVENIIARVGLEEKRNVVMRALSRGMKQRLSLARAFLHKPELLLLDEPYTGLDERACEILDEVFEGFINEGGTIIMTTHNIERGMKQANRIVVFDKGSIVHKAKTSDINIDDFRKEYREIISQ